MLGRFSVILIALPTPKVVAGKSSVAIKLLLALFDSVNCAKLAAIFSSSTFPVLSSLILGDKLLATVFIHVILGAVIAILVACETILNVTSCVEVFRVAFDAVILHLELPIKLAAG